MIIAQVCLRLATIKDHSKMSVLSHSTMPQIAQVAWSPVLRFHSMWWFGGQYHLLVLVHCVFLKTNVIAPVYQDILEPFMLPTADQLFKDADFIFQQDLAPAHTANTPWCWCAWLASELTRPEPHREYMGYCQVENEKQENKKMQMSWRTLSKNPVLSYHISSATNWSPPCHAELRQ